MRPWVLPLLAAGFLLAGGCAHTQPMISPTTYAGSRVDFRVGVSGIYDVNQFDYAPLVRDEIRASGLFKDAGLAHHVGSTDYDYVITGNFGYFQVPTKNGFHLFSIYLVWLPLLSGMPNTHVDGFSIVSFEVYRNGSLLKTYEYKDVFWAERSYLTVWPGPSVDEELKRLTRLLMRDIASDFFGKGRGA